MTDTIKDYCHRLVVKDYNILKIVFTILTSYMIFDTFYTWLVRQPTYTSLEKRPITGDDFPDIMICPQPSVDKEVFLVIEFGGENPLSSIIQISSRVISWLNFVRVPLAIRNIHEKLKHSMPRQPTAVFHLMK